jgi:hypothetical protein
MGNFAEFSFSGRTVAAYGRLRGLEEAAHQFRLAAIARRMSTGSAQMDGIDPDKLTFANVKDGTIKYKYLRKNKLQLLCGTLLDHIKDLELELRLEKAKVEKAKVELRLEEELKEAVFVDKNGTGATSNGEDDVKGVEVGNVNATSSEAKSAKLAKSDKLAKLVKIAKSTDLWCLSPYVPLSQEAKDKQKQRKVCPVNLRGEVCMDDNCGSKHPKVCLVADHGKGKIPKATCKLWHMRIPLARGNSTGNSSNNNARPAKPEKYLIKLKAENRAKELKARIRATKMMLQGITCSQMVEGRPTHQVPAHVVPLAVRTALTPDGAIAILEDTIKRLRLLLLQ